MANLPRRSQRSKPPLTRFAYPLAAAAVRRRYPDWLAALELTVLLALLWWGLFGGQHGLFGALVVAAAVVLSQYLAPLQAMHFSLIGMGRFAVHFLVQSILGAIDVAHRALHPQCPLTPGMWRYALRIPPGPGRGIFIACIGLLPGTVGRRLQGDTLWVHSIGGDPGESLAKLEQRVAGLYGIGLPGEGE